MNFIRTIQKWQLFTKGKMILRMLDMKYGNGMTTYNKIDNVDFNEASINLKKNI